MKNFNIFADMINDLAPGAAQVRNFLVDYNLLDGTAMHGPVQILCIGGSDKTAIREIKRDVKTKYGGTVSGIVEVSGRYTVNELLRIQESPELCRYIAMRPLYYDVAEAERGK